MFISPKIIHFIIYLRLSLFQGPCTGNQQSLAHSRLWDAVVGFLHVFAHMMMKLAQVTYLILIFLLYKHFVCSFSLNALDHIAETFMYLKLA